MLKQLRRITVKKTRLIRTVLGVQISALALYSLVAYPIHAFDYSRGSGPYIDGGEVAVATETTYLYPVVRPKDVSQGYHGLHRGVDIRAVTGTPVVAVDEGVVVEALQESFGYGQHVRVAHKGSRSTLYAHLSKIEVKVGQKIAAGQELGQVGRTGFATGPHLHFEVQENGKTINPLLVLPLPN